MEEVVKVRAELIKKRCEKCKKGYMEYFMDNQNPLDLTHKCNVCGNIEIFSNMYPSVRFINVDTGEIERGML